MEANYPKKLLIFVVAYNAETTINQVISRIPRKLFQDPSWQTEVLIIDDASEDETFEVGHKAFQEHEQITILKNPKNLGYGGNQKLGYQYALNNNFDYVALIHGDGQYAPEELPKLLQPLVNSECAAVFGSRMLTPFAALKGGMPLYKFLGNKILTFIQNKTVGTKLSEYHSGYRLYSCKALAQIPFEYNSQGFDFDTDIIIQLHQAGLKIKELAIPTFYGDEICYVNGIQYATKILYTCFLYRLQALSLFYQAKFDLQEENTQYESKFDFLSSHSLANQAIKKNDKILCLGCGPAELVEPYLKKTNSITTVDMYVSTKLASISQKSLKADLDNFNFESLRKNSYQKILALDIIEHLKSPEDFLKKIRSTSACRNAELILTTPNVAFFPLRIMFLLGSFNYGKRGILDKTHTRLFTFSSLRKILDNHGFEIIETKGIPAPFPLALGRNWLGKLALNLNVFAIKLAPSLFSFQIYIRAKALPTVQQLLSDAKQHTSEQLNDNKQKLIANL